MLQDCHEIGGLGNRPLARRLGVGLVREAVISSIDNLQLYDEDLQVSKADGPSARGEVTRLLASWQSGDRSASDELLPLVYDELRRLAASYLRRERQGHTLQATALVHEAYMRLVGPGLEGATVDNRRHFFAIAAKAMRRVLVDYARRRATQRREGERNQVPIEEVGALGAGPDFEILALHDALVRLHEYHPRQAQVVELRYFGGLGNDEVAEVLGVSRATVERDWQVARLLLHRDLRSGDEA